MTARASLRALRAPCAPRILRSWISALVAALVGCVPDAPERYVRHVPQLATLRLRSGDAIASYDVVLDRWLVSSARGYALIDVAPRATVASPDALRHAYEVEHRVPTTLESRESLSDGFATTLVVHAASEQRVTFIVRQLGNQWVRCVGDMTLCKSVKRG